MKYPVLYFVCLITAASSQRTFTNPILDETAPDPSILKHDGLYYMVYTQGDKIEILKSRTLSNFRNADRSLAYTIPPSHSNLWSPELRFIRGRFYIYFTMDEGFSDENHRMYVIHALTPMGSWSQEIRLLPEENVYAIDGTVLEYGNGQLYLIWTGFPDPPGSMNLYTARMSDPTTVEGPRRLLRNPQMDWEMHGFPVNGAPFTVQKDGRTFLIFSASSTFTPEYCLGIMGIDNLKDPLEQENWWQDVNQCVFTRNDGEGVFGTGGASFVRSPDDRELWMVYHASDNIVDVGGSRRARIQKVDWKYNAPKFPAAVGFNTPMAVPSGE